LYGRMRADYKGDYSLDQFRIGYDWRNEFIDEKLAIYFKKEEI